jgi:hypothetical protein
MQINLVLVMIAIKLGRSPETWNIFNHQNRWVSGLCPTSGIINNWKTNVSETGFFFRIQVRGRRHLHCWVPGQPVSKLLYDWRSLSQSVCLDIEHPCGTCDQILLPVRMLLSEICGLVFMGRPLAMSKRGNRKTCSKNCDEACTEWNYEVNGGENVCHKSSQQTKFTTPGHKNELRIN